MESEILIDRRAYVIDDNDELRRTVSRMLTGAGIYTETFDSSEAFLEKFADLPLGCILLDVRLPGLNGLELLQRLKREGLPHPVIMMSGHGDIPTAVEAVKGGARDFVQKPFRKDELLAVVGLAFEAITSLARSGAHRIELLTPREKNILAAFAHGIPNKIVANNLGLSTRTVEMHRANIVKKLKVDNLTQALFLAKESGFIK